MNAPATEIRKGRKYDQVIDGAREIFLSQGFEGASVDDIARAAGVSKATLYSYFPDKRLLFMEVCTLECQRQAEAALSSIDMAQTPDKVLRQIGDHFTAIILSDIGKRIFRVCVAESERFPDIGCKFYNSGPDRLRTELSRYFRGAIERGELKIENVELACEQFADLCKGDLWMRSLMGMTDNVPNEERLRNVDSAVDMFMARYGANTD